jgi:hypothetical protein
MPAESYTSRLLVPTQWGAVSHTQEDMDAIYTPQLVVGFSELKNSATGRRSPRFSACTVNRVRSSFLEELDGWKTTWASDSHPIGSGAV